MYPIQVLGLLLAKLDLRYEEGHFLKVPVVDVLGSKVLCSIRRTFSNLDVESVHYFGFSESFRSNFTKEKIEGQKVKRQVYKFFLDRRFWTFIH